MSNSHSSAPSIDRNAVTKSAIDHSMVAWDVLARQAAAGVCDPVLAETCKNLAHVCKHYISSGVVPADAIMPETLAAAAAGKPIKSKPPEKPLSLDELSKKLKIAS